MARESQRANVVLRCNVATDLDSENQSRWAGTGHWVRCHTLATALRSIARCNTTIIVAGNTSSVERLAKNFEGVLPANDNAISQLRGLAPDLIVTDINYLAPEHVLQIRKIAPVVNLAPRGLPKYYADATITATEVVDVECPSDGHRNRWHRGPDYAIIRPEIAIRKPTRLWRHREHRILVSMGGIDQANLTQSIANELVHLSEIVPVDIIVGNDYPHTDTLHPIIDKSSKIALHVQPDSFEDFLARASIAVLSVGNVVDEALAMGAAVIGYPLTDYHSMRAQELSDAGAMVALPRVVESGFVESTVRAVIHDDEFRHSLARTGWLRVDGHGTRRAVQIICEVLGLEPTG